MKKIKKIYSLPAVILALLFFLNTYCSSTRSVQTAAVYDATFIEAALKKYFNLFFSWADLEIL